MDKAKKSELTGEIKDMMNTTDALYFIDFSSMTVADVENLRGEFHKAGIKYKVVKNTLAKRALKESDKFSGFTESLSDFLKGPTGIVFPGEDVVSPARILKKASEKTERPKFKAAVLDGQIYGSDKLNELSSLLTKDEIISGICASLNSPVSGIVGTINALMRDLGSIIEEVAKKKAA
ncbi:MAG TPA: 50S ribosomal protein L10 [Ignavibacteria bacterium]|nr:50S ribosomal protein L10 [Ignavibacteria bacterium]